MVYPYIPNDMFNLLMNTRLLPSLLGDSFIILEICVNDNILTRTDPHELVALKSFLHAQFKIKDLGSLHYFLGIEALPSASGVLLHQMKFLHDLR